MIRQSRPIAEAIVRSPTVPLLHDSRGELNVYFAHHGYVGACVDIRGGGSSEGQLPEREYSAQELSDGEEIIAFLNSGERYNFGGIDALTSMSRPPDFPIDENSLGLENEKIVREREWQETFVRDHQ